MKRTQTIAAIALSCSLALPIAVAQPQPAAASAEASNAEQQTYQTLYLKNATHGNEAADILTDLRNILGGRARVFYVPGQNAISIRGSSDDIALAQKIISDLDRPKKLYRLTYTITDMDGKNRIGTQSFSVVAVPGNETDLKQGSRVPVLTETGTAAENSQITYLDVGINIETSIDNSADGVKLHAKIAESSLAEDKTPANGPDPVIRQTTLEGTSTLIPNKPLDIGSLDVPASTRHEEIQVVAELIR